MDDENEIAIVGVGCRFPGASNLDEYWRVLFNGENHVIEIPKERWDNDAYYSENKDEAGKHYVRRAGFMKNHDEWDHRFFGVSENEAARIDPQQRYVLECTHMAMEDGGITRADLKNSQTGVYIGVMNDDYKSLCRRDAFEVSNYCSVGKSTTIIAARVSYTYDLRGPCMVVDTACSSAMIAVHLGAQAIKTGEISMAICGGVSSITSPENFIDLCKARMMSATGQCQAFCDTADGYARGEGCGIVMLKTVKKAMEDGNKIWAIIRTGSNQDGHATSPITAPSGEQQEALLHHVYGQYGLDPTSLQYIEVHGTGTPIGDPTEVNALGKFISSYRQGDSKASDIHEKTDDSQDSDGEERKRKEEVPEYNKVIKIGSVKTNIGHTESAAGTAGLIKVLLMMKHGKLVPSLHLKKDKSNLNQKIKLDEYKLDVALDVEEWAPNKDGDRISCVNSFGFGGSNSHAIVIQKKTLQTPRAKDVQNKSQYSVICLSAVDKTALRSTLEGFGDDILMDDLSLADVASTSVFNRDHHVNRTLVYGKTVDDVSEQVKVKLKTFDKIKGQQSATRLIFVFCGVGTTWNGMCSEMMETQPVFRAKIEEIDRYLEPLAGWKMAEKFENDETEYSDPFLNHVAIFCTQVALFAVWEHWGVLPEVIVGQSVGEVAAAVASGSLSLEDGVTVIYHRSKILAENTGGKMMVVGNLPVEEIQSICDRHGNKVTIAVYNSVTSCTLSGDTDIMDEIKEELDKMNTGKDASILIRPLSVQCAYHSHHVASCMDAIESKLRDISIGNRNIDHISTVTGELAETDEFQTGKYWADNIRQPVQFMQALHKASREKVTNIFVEVGPRQVLRAHLPNIMTESLTGECVPSMNSRKENTSMYSSLCTLYEMGVAINWTTVIPATGCFVDVPRYVFNKSKILHMTEKINCFLKGITKSSDTHMYVRPNGIDGGEYRIEIDKETTPFVFDHFLQNTVLVPGATYVEAAFEIGHRKSNFRAHEVLVSIEFVNTFTPTDDKQYLIDVAVTDMESKGYEYHAVKDGRTLCRGTICERTEPERGSVDIEAIREGCQTHMSKEESYGCLERLNFRYGDSLSLIQQSWTSPTECIVEIAVPDCIKAETKMTFLHPAIIDTMFQTFGVLSTVGTGEGPTLPKGVGGIVINRPPQEHMFCYSQLVKTTAVGNHYNCLLLSPEGYVIAEVQDFYTKTVRVSNAPNQSILYDLTWSEIDGNQEDKDTDSEKVEDTQPQELIVFGTNRFLDSFMPFESQMNAISFSIENVSSSEVETVYENAFSSVENPRAVVFAACKHVDQWEEEKIDIYDLSKNTFLTLALLIKTMREKSYSMPIFVITENVIACQKLNIHASNICGGELWGMVRSAMSETVYPDIRLLDLALTKENIGAFEYLTRLDGPNYNEYIIHEGKLHTSEMLEDPDQDYEPNHRALKTTETDTLLLKSSHPTNVVKPHFQLGQRNTISTNNPSSYIKMKLLTIALHDASIYQTTTAQVEPESTIWPEVNEGGFHVVALEGSGLMQEKPKNGILRKVQENNDPVGFCYPVNVTSTIAIPSKCVFDISSLPVYMPGMMTTCVILWNVAEVCKQSTHIIVVTDDEICHHGLLLENILSKQRKVHITKVSKNHLDILKTNKDSSAPTIVLLTSLNRTHLNRIQEKFDRIQKIVSIDEFLSKQTQKWLFHNMKTTQVHICNTEKLFSSSVLTEKIPKVHHWMKSFDEDLQKQLKSTEENMDITAKTSTLQIPKPTLPLNDGQFESSSIPLRVFKREIFRKDGCYVIIGGLTGLGWELLQLMAELGAGYLATVSRRPPTDETKEKINKIQEQHGCKILCIQVDITDLKQLDTAMKTLQSDIGEAKVLGVFHGGGVVNDKLLINMADADAEKPLLPKIRGTWNLHLVTKDLQLDFFVMHSSIVAILGNSGQCNYAAGNSFQDSFAHYRRSMGLCGQSINWSALALGMATDNKELEKKFKNMGFFYLSREEIRSCFIRAVMEDKPQMTFGIFDWSRLQNNPAMQLYPKKYLKLIEKYGKKRDMTEGKKYRFNTELFGTLDPDGQVKMIEGLIKAILSETLVVEKESLNEDTRFVALGIDSMAAMSFSNSVFDATQVRIPVVQLLSDTTTIGTTTEYIRDKLINTTPDERQIAADASKRFEKFLEGNVTFMQKDFLMDYEKSPKNGELMRQADFVLKGLSLKLKDWRNILHHLLRINPELRRVYVFSDEGGKFDSRLVDPEDATVDLEAVPFNSICNEDSEDCRHEHAFDLSKDLPIKFQIAIRGKTMRMRIFIHSVIGDLRSMSTIFRDIGLISPAYVMKKALPEKEDLVTTPAEYIRRALSPRMLDMHQFWKQQMIDDTEPFTFANDFEQKMEKCNKYEVKETIPFALVDEILTHLQKDGNSLYNFAIAAYILVLHEMTGKPLVPVYTNIDMSGHVPQLASMITRSTNAIPVIGDLRNMGTAQEYIKRSTDKLREMSEMSGFPYALIEEMMPSDALRKNIGRHRFLMHNMRNLNHTSKHSSRVVSIKAMNAYHKRHVYETVLYVVYDLEAKHVELEFAYNTASLRHEQALDVPRRVIDLMQALIKHETTAVADLLKMNILNEANSASSSPTLNPKNKTLEMQTDNMLIEKEYIKTDKMLNGNGYVNGNGNIKTDELVNGNGHTVHLAAENMDTYPREGNTKVIREDHFLKQTSQGWDHDVRVVMTTDNSKGGLKLQWGRAKDSDLRTVPLESVRDVHVKRVNGLYLLLINIPKRVILLKTGSRVQATDWLNAFKSTFYANNKASSIATELPSLKGDRL